MSLLSVIRRPVVTVGPSCTVRDAARRMMAKSVGALVVTELSGATPTGIVTDRDLVALVAEGVDPDTATVACLAQSRLETVFTDQGVRDVTDRMHKHGVRRLPVTDRSGRLVGIVSLDDILVLLGREMADVAETIQEEISRERARAGRETLSLSPRPEDA